MSDTNHTSVAEDAENRVAMGLLCMRLSEIAAAIEDNEYGPNWRSDRDTLRDAATVIQEFVKLIPVPSDAAASSSSTPLSGKTPTAVMCDGCGQIAARDREPESVIGYKHHCGGTWRRLSLAPLSEPTNE